MSHHYIRANANRLPSTNRWRDGWTNKNIHVLISTSVINGKYSHFPILHCNLSSPLTPPPFFSPPFKHIHLSLSLCPYISPKTYFSNTLLLIPEAWIYHKACLAVIFDMRGRRGSPLIVEVSTIKKTIFWCVITPPPFFFPHHPFFF